MKKIVILAALALLLAPAAGAQTQGDAPKINKKNLVIKEWNTAAGTNKKVLDHQTIYNPEGKKLEEKEFNSDGLKWRKRYEYNAAGKVSVERVYNEKNKLVTVKKFEYNEFGRKKVQYNYDAKGKLLTTKTFEYIAQDSE